MGTKGEGGELRGKRSSCTEQLVCMCVWLGLCMGVGLGLCMGVGVGLGLCMGVGVWRVSRTAAAGLPQVDGEAGRRTGAAVVLVHEDGLARGGGRGQMWQTLSTSVIASADWVRSSTKRA